MQASQISPPPPRAIELHSFVGTTEGPLVIGLGASPGTLPTAHPVPPDL